MSIAMISLGLGIGLDPRRAAADGAFPDALNVVTPPDRPLEILLSTNFGVVFSKDGGQTWLWTCEQAANSLGWFYQIGPPPRHRVFTVARQALAYSDDLTCGWRVAGGGVAGQDITDAWVDRVDPDRVLAIGARCCEGYFNIYSLFESRDGGSTFGAARYVAATGDTITGAETSASDPRLIYLTLARGRPPDLPDLPAVARSSDGGATWQLQDLSTSLGVGRVRLIAVDAVNPEKIYLLWSDSEHGQALAISEDGGATASVRLQTAANGAVIRAFLRTGRSVLLAATDVNGAPDLFRSRDGGLSFQPVAARPAVPHVRGFSGRDPLVYAATDNARDGYAVATSEDDGDTWVPLMSYDQVKQIAGCVKATCQSMCEQQVPLLWSSEVCQAGGDVGVPAPPPSRSSAGCGCGLASAAQAGQPAPELSWTIAGFALALFLSLARGRVKMPYPGPLAAAKPR